MKVSQEFSKYMSSFLMDFNKPKFFNMYASTNEKYTFPSDTIIFFMRILLLVIFLLNLTITILYWISKSYSGASVFTVSQVFFAFSLIFEPIIQKKKILVSFHGMFYIITMLFYSIVYKVFLRETLSEYKTAEYIIYLCSEFY